MTTADIYADTIFALSEIGLGVGEYLDDSRTGRSSLLIRHSGFDLDEGEKTVFKAIWRKGQH